MLLNLTDLQSWQRLLTFFLPFGKAGATSLTWPLASRALQTLLFQTEQQCSNIVPENGKGGAHLDPSGPRSTSRKASCCLMNEKVNGGIRFELSPPVSTYSTSDPGPAHLVLFPTIPNSTPNPARLDERNPPTPLTCVARSIQPASGAARSRPREPAGSARASDAPPPRHPPTTPVPAGHQNCVRSRHAHHRAGRATRAGGAEGPGVGFLFFLHAASSIRFAHSPRVDARATPTPTGVNG